MAVWTVDTWRVRPEREAHFLAHCEGLTPDALILYRDLHERSLFWSPTKWVSLDALERWRASPEYMAASRAVEDDLLDHQTHTMTAVVGFLPHTAGGDPS